MSSTSVIDPKVTNTNWQMKTDSHEETILGITPREHSKGINLGAFPLELEKLPTNKLLNCATLASINHSSHSRE